MAAIGRVLGTLPDDTARRRVLRWACERFGLEPAAAAAALLPEGMFAETVNVADDPMLKIDSLDDMFPDAPDNDDLAIPDPTLAPSSDGSRPPVESVLRSFVEEFQRFAEEWSGATA